MAQTERTLSESAARVNAGKPAQFTGKFPAYRKIISCLKKVVNANNFRMRKIKWPQ